MVNGELIIRNVTILIDRKKVEHIYGEKHSCNAYTRNITMGKKP